MEKLVRTVLILPAYNEEQTIEAVIEEFAQHMPNDEIVVVNNASKDRTEEIARATLKRLGHPGRVLNETRKGKAFAIRRAFADIDADIYVMVDADLTYPADAVQKLIEPVRDNRADMVVGDRHSLGGYSKENKRPLHEFGNNLVKWLINHFFNGQLTDILSGYRVFSRKYVKNFPILTGGFTLETEITLHTLDKGFTIIEVPVTYKDRPEGSVSKLDTISDGFRVLKLIFRIFKDYKPLAFFGLFSALFGALSLLAGYPVLEEYFRTNIILHIPLAILATGFGLVSLISLTIGLILDTVAANNRFQYALRLIDYPALYPDESSAGDNRH
jgi:glycosyltransferase involved in cell wall biosynthesis